MITKHETLFTKDVANNKVIVAKEFDADIKKVWEAWTSSTLLDKWWAPKPWRAETKRMNFEQGGYWLYSMVGPNGERLWSRFDYTSIYEPHQFTATDSFCDENGEPTRDALFPSMHWTIKFHETHSGTRVEVLVLASKQADLQKMLDTGFEEGFKMALDNLEELLAEE